jgi:riboflavin synthase
MFTGLVEEVGRIRSVTRDAGGSDLVIEGRRVLEDAVVGASIAVNGCCLTVVQVGDGAWTTHAQPETLDRTTLGAWAAGDAVNLERPVSVGDRLGGHLVQGHVDGIGRVRDRSPLADGAVTMTIEAGVDLVRYVVEKGSITVDGVSLTVSRVSEPGTFPASFEVALIPHTLAATTLGTRGLDDGLNLEVDVLAKYVERLLADRLGSPYPS